MDSQPSKRDEREMGRPDTTEAKLRWTKTARLAGKCDRCPPHGGENLGRRPRSDKHKDHRSGLQKSATHSTANQELLDALTKCASSGTSQNDVLRALEFVGLHSGVTASVSHSRISRDSRILVEAWISVGFRSDSPVCCGELGCYVPALGQKRREVPSAIQDSLNLIEVPDVHLYVSVEYPPEYRHTGLSSVETEPFSFEMPPEEFR